MEIINIVCKSKVPTAPRSGQETKETCLGNNGDIADDGNALAQGEIMETLHVDNNSKATSCSHTSFHGQTEHTSELSRNIRESSNSCLSDEPRKNIETTGITRAGNDEKGYCQSSHIEKAEKEFRMIHQEFLLHNHMPCETSHEEENEVAPLTVADVPHSNNQIRDLVSETSDEEGINNKMSTPTCSNCSPESSSDPSADMTTVANMRYGAIPDKQATGKRTQRHKRTL